VFAFDLSGSNRNASKAVTNARMIRRNNGRIAVSFWEGKGTIFLAARVIA
jgi:hypothetical protein